MSPARSEELQLVCDRLVCVAGAEATSDTTRQLQTATIENILLNLAITIDCLRLDYCIQKMVEVVVAHRSGLLLYTVRSGYGSLHCIVFTCLRDCKYVNVMYKK